MRALIVDDNSDNLYFLRSLLQGNGYTVNNAENGAQALKFAREQTPDVIVSDLLMPVMDGFTLLRECKSDRSLRSVAFVVYTATYIEPRDEKLALDWGADAFLVKPSEPDVLMATIQHAIERAHRVQDALTLPEPPVNESTLKLYSDILIGKLEKRNSQLEVQVTRLADANQKIGKLSRLYSALSGFNQSIVYARDKEALLPDLCRIAVERGGLAVAWVFLLDSGTQIPTQISRYGPEPKWVDRLIPLPPGAMPETPLEFALLSKDKFICNDLLAESSFARWHQAFKSQGLASGASFALVSNKKLLGGISFFASELGYFDEEHTELVEEMAEDIVFALTNFDNVVKRQDATYRLEMNEEILRLRSQALEASANGIMISEFLPPKLTISYVNPAFERMTGYTRKEILGKDASFLLGKDTEQLGMEEITAALRTKKEANVTLKNYRKDGSMFWSDIALAPMRNKMDVVTHFVSIINDITERIQHSEQLERQNNQDALTGLASRTLLKDRTNLAIEFAVRQNRSVAVLFIDIDNFKRINESLGHAIGDVLLQRVATRLSEYVRDRDTLGRLGGDDFVLVLSDLARAEDVSLIAGKIAAAFEQPFVIENRDFLLTVSMGVSLHPQDGNNFDTLLRNADAAKYRAKDEGRSAIRFYTADMNQLALQKLETESRLRLAIERNELLLHFQPLQDLKTQEIQSVEALVRWRGPDGKLISPLNFIGLAEETGLIVPIGRWILRTACNQVQEWRKQGVELQVAVNLSARQFKDGALIQTVREALIDSQLPPHLLKLEITESAVMEDAEVAIGILHQLKSLGLSISVDDFGTGYSSLAYLRLFPLDQLKIDRSFIKDMTDQPQSIAIVQSIIALARNLNLQTVSEGVETVEQREFLRSAGCDLLQGFLLSRPLPPSDLLDFVKHHRAHIE
jgi:diguanylate cyclase (GGDEF)-like protein/PAS domain S-box-containing protein